MVTNQLYDTLVRLGDDGGVEPGLALAWSRPEPTVLRLELRPGVRFHDGRPLDAEAVAASLRRLADPATGARGAFLVASHRRHRDPRRAHPRPDQRPTVRAAAGQPDVPRHGDRPPGAGPELGRTPIGTGPFRFAGWRDGDAVELVADPDYWGGPPPLAGVRFRVIPERAAQLIAFRAGDLQLIHDLPPDAFRALEGATGGRARALPQRPHQLPRVQRAAPAPARRAGPPRHGARDRRAAAGGRALRRPGAAPGRPARAAGALRPARATPTPTTPSAPARCCARPGPRARGCTSTSRPTATSTTSPRSSRPPSPSACASSCG
jgi:hypothetical protein